MDIGSYYENTNNLIDNSPFKNQFKNMFTLRMNKAITQFNNSYLGNDDRNALQFAIQLRQSMKNCEPLLKGNNLNLTCQYITYILINGDSEFDEFSTLHDIYAKHGGYNIFNFVVHLYSLFLWEDKKSSVPADVKIRYGMANLLKGQFSGSSHHFLIKNIPRDSHIILPKLNSIFNNYLIKIGIMYKGNDNYYHFTKIGNKLCHNSFKTMKKFIKHYHVSYHPSMSLVRFMFPILEDIRETLHNPKINKYCGLIFAQDIIGFGPYKDFCYYTSKDFTNSSNKKIPRTLALYPMIYMCCLMSLFDCIFVKKHNIFRISKACLEFLKQFEHLDVIAKGVIDNPY